MADIMKSPESKINILSGCHKLIAGLPSEHIVHVFSKKERLEAEAQTVHDSLRTDECDKNQWLLVLGLSKSTIDRLSSDKWLFNVINCRFRWEGTTGLIKPFPPSPLYERINSDFTMLLSEELAAMGIPRDDRRWGLATFYQLCRGNRGKQGDQAFLPLQRQRTGNQADDWPTLVLETGVSGSKPKLEEDTKWWFNNSKGRVRIVLVVAVAKFNVVFEKWQLLLPDAPANATREYTMSLGEKALHMPPLVSQAAINQRCFCAQEVIVDRGCVVGGPMVLPFKALFDRDPGPSEVDVSITALDFQEITAKAFES